MHPTYFLHEYLTGTPNCAAATLKGEPALKFFFFPLYVNTVICNWPDDDDADAVVGLGNGTTKASEEVIA
jgi:hypothetical protein